MAPALTLNIWQMSTCIFPCLDTASHLMPRLLQRFSFLRWSASALLIRTLRKNNQDLLWKLDRSPTSSIQVGLYGRLSSNSPDSSSAAPDKLLPTQVMPSKALAWRQYLILPWFLQEKLSNWHKL